MRSPFIDRLRRKDPCPHCGGSGVRPSGLKLAVTAEREEREEMERLGITKRFPAPENAEGTT